MPHHDVIDAAAEVAGDGAVGDADHERDERGDETDDQRDTSAPEDASE